MKRGCLALTALLWLTGCAAPTPYRTISLRFDGPAATELGNDSDELRIAQVVAHLIRERLDRKSVV